MFYKQKKDIFTPQDEQNPYAQYSNIPQMPQDQFQLIPEQQMPLDPNMLLQGNPLGIDSTFVRWQQDTDDVLANIENELKGYEKENGNWKIVLPLPKNALLNELGISDMIRLCRINFSKVMNSSNFDIEEINQLAWDFELDIIDALEFNYDRYQIKKPQDCGIIFGIVRNPYMGILKQSFGDGTRKYLGGGVLGYREAFQNMDRDAQNGRSGNMFGLFNRR